MKVKDVCKKNPQNLFLNQWIVNDEKTFGNLDLQTDFFNCRIVKNRHEKSSILIP